MKKVDVFVVGGAKCGTTWLHNVLALRDDVSLPEQKETNFFAFMGEDTHFTGPHDDENTNKYTIKNLETYQSLFDKGKRYWVEVCPSYLYVKNAARNIFEYNPEAKIIIILRNPVDRAWSNYQHLVRDGAESETFENALALEETRENSGWVWFWNLYRQGLYVEQVRRYLDLFPGTSVKIMKFEDIHKNPLGFMREIELFAGLPETAYRFAVEQNESGTPAGPLAWLHKVLYFPGGLNKLIRSVLPVKLRKQVSNRFKKSIIRKTKMDLAMREELSRRYRLEIEDLESLTGISFSEWKVDANPGKQL